MAIHAYHEDYLLHAQAILGNAVDFATMTLNVDPSLFGSALATSTCGRQFSCGNPTFVAGLNGCEFARMVLDDAGIHYPEAEDAMYLDKSPEYWAGWALAYYQWERGCTFMDVLAYVDLEEIVDMYPIYHEMDIERFVERLDEILATCHPATRLSERRAACGYSQAELSQESGVSLRQIQLFEQRQRDINKAAAITLLRLSRALYCAIEDLIEWQVRPQLRA